MANGQKLTDTARSLESLWEFQFIITFAMSRMSLSDYILFFCFDDDNYYIYIAANQINDRGHELALSVWCTDLVILKGHYFKR